MTVSNRWQRDRISPLALQLDPDNPRFELTSHSQEAILLHLLRDHDVIALAKSIIEAKELWPTETVLTYFDGKQHIVLEGNRRTAACKILLNPEILPESAYDLLPQIPVIDDETRNNISKIDVCFDYDRERGDPIVANIHAVIQRRAWSLVSRMRYVHREFKKSKNEQEIAQTLKIDLKTVKQLLRGREALQIAIHGNVWPDDEKAILYRDEQVDHEPFLRAVLSRRVEHHFGQPMFFDDGRPNRFGFSNLDQMVGVIARHTLIAQRRDTDDKFSKGDSVEDYLRRTWPIGDRVNEVVPCPGKEPDLFDMNRPAGGLSLYTPPNRKTEGRKPAPKPPTSTEPTDGQLELPDNPASPKDIPPNGPEDGANGSHMELETPPSTVSAHPLPADCTSPPLAPMALPDEMNSDAATPSTLPPVQKPRPLLLLEDIRCLRDDDRLKRLTYELTQLSSTKNNLTSFRLSLFMLMRALLEWALVYHYDQIKLPCRDDNGQHFPIGRLVGMASTRTEVFRDNKKLSERASTIASHWLKDLHWNSHNDMGNWSIERLQNIAGDLRPILRFILMDAVYEHFPEKAAHDEKAEGNCRE
ncbi:hypothetical protein CCC_02184 [Paramagnetospirillum magnetotacticum MS-1]|uniref:ParB/Sulfiredoxin domain-containing protein n=1 Tax=Paramagnetospirillum magnetotacticum MS-1 TaxID=272627 RepID=A0A0C2YG59_PARME|nr:hypothetical protein [Paramagnetospirillum magnetotacticum]KIL98734.1 hypothetical protein CCC_02184 [Paramagnetospirillum magnetotacticum MS-1]